LTFRAASHALAFMSLKTFLRIFAAFGAAAVFVALPGCGNDKDRDKDDRDDRDHRRRAYVSRVSALAARMDQLDETLDQLEQETVIQQNRIAAAKGDLAVIRETIAGYETRVSRYVDATTTGAIARDRRDADRRTPDRHDREKAEDATLSTLLLVAFLAIVIVFGAKMWRDRRRTEEEDIYPPPESPGSAASYTYPAPPTVQEPPAAMGETPIVEPAPEAETRPLDTSQDENPPPTSGTV
jgi:hypothetical protein